MAKPGKGQKTKGNSVFVVHGRDEVLRKSMFDFLRALGLNPME
jgi:predicted nucleotide-binding protein